MIFLDQARMCRECAAGARRLCWETTDTDLIACLDSYASEMEQRASQLEAQAARLIELETEIRVSIDKARDTLDQIQQMMAPDDPNPT